MNTKLFVGNLPPQITENELQDLFAQEGPVTDVNLITDRTTGESRGFAFVTMSTPENAASAIRNLDGHSFDGQTIKVSEARPREDRPQGARSGGGGGGGGRGGPRRGGSAGRR